MLEEEFTELPAQGVNAGLEGIMPRKGDWGREEEDWWGRRVDGRGCLLCRLDNLGRQGLTLGWRWSCMTPVWRKTLCCRKKWYRRI